MKNLLSPSRPLLFLFLGFASVAGVNAQAQGDPVQPAAPVAHEQDSLQGYTFAQRSDFTVAVSKAAANIDSLIIPLTKRQKGGIAGGADAMTMERLQTSRNELGHAIGKLENATPEDWAALRDGTLDALAQTQEAYEKAAKEYNQP